ncbi:DUF6281 family protein [Streptomyces sp. NPDC057287]|uniref:DUF6281 family protein n=1 Tax=Streptomyces sp. NPDC057287 TaxID=3346086 RepID=UPI00362C8295
MNCARRASGVALTAVMLMSVTACSSGSDSDGGSASCAYRVAYEGRVYREVSKTDGTAGQKLGSATVPPCDENSGGDKVEQEVVTVYAVNGVSSEIAVAVGDGSGGRRVVAAYSGMEVPSEIKKLIDDN